MRCQGNLKDFVPKYNAIASDSEQVLGCLYSVYRNCFFIAVADASVSIVVLNVFDDELLPNINDFRNLFTIEVDDLDGKLTGSNSQNLAFLIEFHRCYRASIVLYFVIKFDIIDIFNVVDG